MPRVLIVDDQPNMRITLAMMLRDAGHEVSEADDGEEAIARVNEDSFDVVLTDLRMDRVDGMEVLRHVKEHSPLTEVLVMTAYGTIETAVEAMRLGAHDYVQKPFSEDELLLKVERAAERRQLASEMSVLASEFRERYHCENIVGRSQSIRDLLGRIVRIGPTDATVLITGESGTGKELVARAIHANSNRSERPFVPVNCATISENLLESELFGHMKGAFTGAGSTRKGLLEEANGGTFFFDEIGEMPLSLQAKLLRAIQEGTIRRLGDNHEISVDVRIVAATNRDLKAMIEQRTFRDDLYYRLNVVRMQVPSLRDRREDIALLAQYFLEKYGKKMGRDSRFGAGVLEFLGSYDFPGNVRELENLMEQGVALSDQGIVRLEDVAPSTGETDRPLAGHQEGFRKLQDIVDDAERQYIQQTLATVGGSREEAAERLGLSVTTLWRKMKRLEL